MNSKTLFVIGLYFGLLSLDIVSAQNTVSDTASKDSKIIYSSSKKDAYVIGLLPTTRENVYGIGLGLIGSESFCNLAYTRNSYGLNIQVLGQGVFVPLNRRFYGYKVAVRSDSSWMVKSNVEDNYRAKHNGLLVSSFGTMTQVSNGVVLSGLTSLGIRMSGLAFNLLYLVIITHSLKVFCWVLITQPTKPKACKSDC